MLFNSVPFLLVFLPATLLVFNWAKQRSLNAALVTLLVASLIFYSWWDIRFTPLLVTSVVLNYAFGKFLRTHRTRGSFALGIALNLAPLFVFKYAGWVASMVDAPLQSLVLPLGISFFTFLQIGYLANIYRGQSIDRGFLAYSVFVTYFPHLIAGPILKHEEVASQLMAIDRRPIELGERFAKGMLLLVVGLFKKVIVADALCASLANSVFAAARTANFTEAWTGALAYSAQLYFDFSGYCEMALGMSLMLGIVIPINFSSPYRARNIAVFWRTWHISLGTWFREHVYVPLGGNRNGMAMSLLALGITFFLTGLWHGAQWTFVAWGCLHGGYLATYRIWQTTCIEMPESLAKTITLLSVIFAWVLFRATSFDDAAALWKSMVGLNGITIGAGFSQFAEYLPSWIQIKESRIVFGSEVLLYAVLLGWCATAKNVHEFKLRPTLKHAGYIGALGLMSMMFINKASTFLYFQW